MQKQNIFLLGAYGQNNIGDDALLEIFLTQLSQFDIVVNSAQPEQTSQRYGVRSVPTYSSGWPRFQRPLALLRADMIVFGGGSLLKEIEGGLIARLLYFVRIFAVLLYAKLFGRHTAMLGVGMGPLALPRFRWLACQAANLTDLICVRDTASRDLLESIGVKTKVHVTADPVFTLDPIAQATAKLPHNTTAHADPIVVVIPRYSLTAAEQSALATACDHLVTGYGAQIRFMPFQIGYQSQFDDLRAARGVMQKMKHVAAAAIWNVETPRAALEHIAQADFVLSTRLHGLIFAAIQGVAAVAVNYEVKVQNFMTELGLPWASVTLAELASGALPSVLDRAWATRTTMVAQMRERVTPLRQAAMQNFEQLRALAAGPSAHGLLSGSALLIGSMTLVHLGNYFFNLLLGRWLGPAVFADLSLIITTLLILTLITATLQRISTKFAATYTADGSGDIASLRHWLNRRAWVLGIIIGAGIGVGAPLWQSFFHTETTWPFIILSLGIPFYLAQGVDRGFMQGQTKFGLLSLSYQGEMWVRLLAAILFVAIGWSLNGAVAGLTFALLATWLIGAFHYNLPHSQPTEPPRALPHEQIQAIRRFSIPVAIALVGQVLINNSDILIVKHFFAAELAGQYAALALIGRIVFFATASVIATMFPLVAQRQQRGEPHRKLLWLAFGLVAFASLAIIGLTIAIPDLIVQVLFGAAYLSIGPLLWQYAVATALYSLANVIICYRLAAGYASGSMLALLTGLAQIVGLWFFHNNLAQVVLVQIVLMGILLLVMFIWDLWSTHRQPTVRPGTAPSNRSLIGFLKSRLSIFFGGALLIALLLMWQVARAEAPTVGHPAQQELALIMPSLIDSEAEHASGAYIPGMGAVITMHVVRGPNAVVGKTSYVGMRDWMVYLMQTFGPKLDAVPRDEKIAISADFYDYDDTVYHQLVILVRAGDAADPGTYAFWLDGKPFEQAASELDATRAGPGSQQLVAPETQPIPAPAAQSPAGTTDAPAAPAPAGGSIVADFADPQASAKEWGALTDRWSFAEQGYVGSAVGLYDQITMFNRAAVGDLQIQAEVKFLEGEMGAGLIFNAPDSKLRNNAQMVSYTAKGSYLQWGSFDKDGNFQFKGGSNVPNGGDGKWHTLAVRVTGKTYSVSVDGTILASDLPFDRPAGGFVGLTASTSRVIYDNVKIEGALK